MDEIKPEATAPVRKTRTMCCRLCRKVRTVQKITIGFPGHSKPREVWVCRDCTY